MRARVFILLLIVFGDIVGLALDGHAQQLPSGFKAVETVTDISSRGTESFVIAADETPLGSRVPLILIHGWNFDGVPAASLATSWEPFITYFNSETGLNGDLPLNKRYKLFLYTYPSNLYAVTKLGEILASLMKSIDAQNSEFAQDQIVILAHSMGGLVARSFMEEPLPLHSGKWSDRVVKLITLATPHHGTPAANNNTGALGQLLTSRFNYLRPAQALITDAVLFINTKFPPYYSVNRSDLLWDNFDGLFKKGFSTGEQQPWLARFNAKIETKNYDNKLVVYAGTISNGHWITGNGENDAQLRATATILSDGLAIPNDGIVPLDSALFEGRIHPSQHHIFADYDHFQMCKSRGNKPSDALFNTLAADLHRAVASPPVSALTQSASPPTGHLVQAQQIYDDDFSALTVKAFLGLIKAKNVPEAFRRVLQQPPTPQRTLEAVKRFIDGDQRLKDIASFRLLTSRHDPPLARVVAETKNPRGETFNVTFILRGDENDPEGESWEIDRIQSSSEFPGSNAEVYEFRLHRWGFITLDASPGHEQVRIFGGDKETTETALQSPLKRSGLGKFSTLHGTTFTVKKLVVPVINDGNRKINSGDWQLVVSGNGPEYQQLKKGHWLTASFGDTGNNTFYGKLVQDQPEPESVSSSSNTDNTPAEQGLESRLIGKWMGHRHVTEYFADHSFKWDTIADRRMRWHLEGTRVIEIYPDIPDYNGVYYPGPVSLSFSIISLTQTRLFGLNQNGAQFVEYRIEQDTAEARQLAAKQVAADEQQISVSAAVSSANAQLPPELQLLMNTSPTLFNMEIDASRTPVFLIGDFNGDGKQDFAVSVKSKKTGSKDLAIACAGGEVLLASSETSIGRNYPSPDWKLIPKNTHISSRPEYNEDHPPPTLIGDAISLERPESSSAVLYWNEGHLRLYWVTD